MLRDGQPVSVDAAELVREDVMLLSAGDRVAADLLVQVGHELRLDESLVTGESGGGTRPPRDRLLAGTFIVQGEGPATVVATGVDTTLAGISALAGSTKRPPSRLSHGPQGIGAQHERHQWPQTASDTCN